MKASRRVLKAMREEVRQGPYRSTLYWWMVDNHSDLVEEGPNGRMPWIKLCKRFANLGLTDGAGKPPTQTRAAKTWLEACAAVRDAAARELATAQLPRPPPPSRQRADWQPPVTTAPPPPPTYRQHPGHEEAEEQLPPRRPLAKPSAREAPGEAKKMTIEDLNPEARAQIERLRQDFAETDRKRFGRF
jgi:hypothetical protein